MPGRSFDRRNGPACAQTIFEMGTAIVRAKAVWRFAAHRCSKTWRRFARALTRSGFFISCQARYETMRQFLTATKALPSRPACGSSWRCRRRVVRVRAVRCARVVQSTLSTHLQYLRLAGLRHAQRRQVIYYRLTNRGTHGGGAAAAASRRTGGRPDPAHRSSAAAPASRPAERGGVLSGFPAKPPAKYE